MWCVFCDTFPPFCEYTWQLGPWRRSPLGQCEWCTSARPLLTPLPPCQTLCTLGKVTKMLYYFNIQNSPGKCYFMLNAKKSKFQKYVTQFPFILIQSVVRSSWQGWGGWHWHRGQLDRLDIIGGKLYSGHGFSLLWRHLVLHVKSWNRAFSWKY